MPAALVGDMVFQHLTAAVQPAVAALRERLAGCEWSKAGIAAAIKIADRKLAAWILKAAQSSRRACSVCCLRPYLIMMTQRRDAGSCESV